MAEAYYSSVKRPQSAEKLGRNIKNAYKQLEQKYKSPIRTRHRGIIAVDITKLINPEFLLFVQPNADAVDRGISSIIDSFVTSNEKLWQLRRNSRTMAIVLRIAIMAINQEKDGMLTYYQQYVVTPLAGTGARNTDSVSRLASALGATRKIVLAAR